MERFKILADILCDMKYFDKTELVDLLSVHFRMWMDDEMEDMASSSEITKQRASLLSNQESTIISRMSIKSQIQRIEYARKKGKKIDFNNLQRLRLKYTIKATELNRISARLSVLKSLEKQQNIEKHMTDDRIVRAGLFRFVADEYGDEMAKGLIMDILKEALNV